MQEYWVLSSGRILNHSVKKKEVRKKQKDRSQQKRLTQLCCTKDLLIAFSSLVVCPGPFETQQVK